MKIGFTELLIVFIVALFVIGPDKIPLYAKKLGEGLAAFRKYSQEATNDIKESIVEPLEEAQQPLREAMEPINETAGEIQKSVKEVQDSFSDLTKPLKPDKKADAAKSEQAEKPAGTEQLSGTMEAAAEDSTDNFSTDKLEESV